MPLIVRADEHEWRKFVRHVEFDKANENSRLQTAEQKAETDKILSGLLKEAPPKTALDKALESQRERTRRIALGLEKPAQSQERGLERDDRW